MKAEILVKDWERIWVIWGRGRAFIKAFDSLTQPEETGNNHIGWTDLHQLSASSGILGFVGLNYYREVCGPQLIPGLCLSAKQKSDETDRD